MIYFVSDFMFWTENHIYLVSKSLPVRLRDTLFSKGVKIKKTPFLSMSKALSEYIAEYADMFESASWGMKRNSSVQLAAVSNRHSYHLGSHAETAHVKVHHDAKSSDREPSDPEPPEKAASRELYENPSGSHNRERVLPDNNQSASCPADLSKYFNSDLKYSGSSRDPLRRKYMLFVDACQFCCIQASQGALVLGLMQTNFLKAATLNFYLENIRGVATTGDQAVFGETISRAESSNG